MTRLPTLNLLSYLLGKNPKSLKQKEELLGYMYSLLSRQTPRSLQSSRKMDQIFSLLEAALFDSSSQAAAAVRGLEISTLRETVNTFSVQLHKAQSPLSQMSYLEELYRSLEFMGLSPHTSSQVTEDGNN